jgi:SAM-dependent methyltransferase
MLAERESSQDTAALANRIAANNQFGSADLTAWLLDRLNIRAGERLLDLGCGTGKHLRAFAEAGAVCTGLDVSAPSLAAIDPEGVTLHCRSMDGLSGIEGPFDTVAAIYSLYYSANAGETLRQARDRLAPRGRICVVGPYSDNNAEWFRFIGQFMTLPDNVLHSTGGFMFEEVLSFAVEHFPQIRCDRFENEITIPDLDALRRYWRSNIYYREELDSAFDHAAERHFANNSTFAYRKVAQLIEMRQ